MDIIKINSYIDLKDFNSLRSYVDDSLTEDPKYNQVLLASVNTLLFSRLYSLSPDNSAVIFHRTNNNILKDIHCLNFIEEYYSPVDDVPEISDPNIRVAIEYINKNLKEDLSLEVLATQLDLSKNYFSNLFKEKTGIRFSKYVNIQRINKSKKLLRLSGSSMDDIAKQCGFNSQSHFSTTFLRIEDQTPTEYRKQTNNIL